MQDDLTGNHSGEKPSETANPKDAHLGMRLRLRRNQIGMSQEQLGKALGLTFQQIQKYERAANRIAASRLHDLAELLEVPITWFYEGLPTASAKRGFAEDKQSGLEGVPNALPEAEILQRRETLDLVRAYYSITDEKQRRKIFELVRSMAEDTP